MSLPLPKKRFGQHFLHDGQVIERILRHFAATATDRVVEIGPGPGALTAPLLHRLDALTVVELDRDVLPYLRQACGEHAQRLRIIQADALEVDYAALLAGAYGLRLIGNLPYNISTPLLFHLLRFADVITDMHFMLQKEVVDRMCAGPGDEAYGRLSVALAARAEVTALFDVGPGAFKPPPKVWSSVVRLRPRPARFVIDDWALFDQVLAAAFGQRRKTLGNALKALCHRDQLEALQLDPQLRAEVLPAEAFARIANALAAQRAATAAASPPAD